MRDHVATKTIELQYVPIKPQLADCLTNLLPQKQFDALVNKSGVRAVPLGVDVEPSCHIAGEQLGASAGPGHA